MRHASHYFTGKPCSRGHVALRYVSTGNCAECAKMATKAYNDRTRGKVRPVAPGSLTVIVHPDDHEAVYVLVDYLNQQRGLPPAPRPDTPAVAPPVDPRTQWEVWYDRLRPIYGADIAHARATELAGPEAHSPGWAGAAPVVAIDPREALRQELQAPAYGGGAKPDYL